MTTPVAILAVMGRTRRTGDMTMVNAGIGASRS